MNKIVTGICEFIRKDGLYLNSYRITDLETCKSDELEFLRTLKIFNDKYLDLPYNLKVEKYGNPIINENSELIIVVEFPRKDNSNEILKYSYECRD